MSGERLERIEWRLKSIEVGRKALEDGQKAIMRDLEALKDEVDRNNRDLLRIQQDNTETSKQTKDLMETVIRVVVRLDERVSRLEDN
jgi:uncharacterized protein (DUF3084 family)